MNFSQAIGTISGLRYMADRLEVHSGPGRHALSSLRMMTDAAQIEAELAGVESLVSILRNDEGKQTTDMIALRLMQVKDIKGSISKLAAGLAADEVELFEIKAFMLLAIEIRDYAARAAITVADIPDMEAAVAILDPDGRRIPHFAIYDTYSRELAQVRRRLREVRSAGTADDRELESLYDRNALLEDEVRVELSAKLAHHATRMAAAADQIARLDIMLAKARQAVEMGLCRPLVGDTATIYEGLCNPEVAEAVGNAGGTFCPVDIKLGCTSTLITGANMGGKTVLLKSVALSQMLFQFGFFVPTARAEIVPADEVFVLMEDGQDSAGGLSSFAYEMGRLAYALEEVRRGRKLLVIADEPARTTNPKEGRAIVNALLEALAENKVMSLVTSHYDGLDRAGRQLRVRGLENVPGETVLQRGEVNRLMDYTLVEWTGTEAPQEAIRIARMLGSDKELVDRAEKLAKE